MHQLFLLYQFYRILNLYFLFQSLVSKLEYMCTFACVFLSMKPKVLPQSIFIYPPPFIDTFIVFQIKRTTWQRYIYISQHKFIYLCSCYLKTLELAQIMLVIPCRVLQCLSVYILDYKHSKRFQLILFNLSVYNDCSFS